jgi:hypothetical protein
MAVTASPLLLVLHRLASSGCDIPQDVRELLHTVLCCVAASSLKQGKVREPTYIYSMSYDRYE